MMVDKKANSLENEGILEIIEWINGLNKEEIRQNISNEISKDGRVKLIQKEEGDISQPLRWENLDTFKNEASVNTHYAIAQRSQNFPIQLVQRQNILNQLCENLDQEMVEVLKIKLLVLYKSPESFVELTPEQIVPFKNTLREVILSIINNKIEEKETELAALVEDVDDVQEDELGVVEETENDGVEVEEVEEGPEIEWTPEMIAGINKISHLLEEEPQSIIDRLIRVEVDIIRDQIEYFLSEDERREVLPLLYKLDIRTFTQLESHDPAIHLGLGTITEEQANAISELKYKFGK